MSGLANGLGDIELHLFLIFGKKVFKHKVYSVRIKYGGE
jgi:hypothetical protein